jgi:hypothetical protein
MMESQTIQRQRREELYRDYGAHRNTKPDNALDVMEDARMKRVA